MTALQLCFGFAVGETVTEVGNNSYDLSYQAIGLVEKSGSTVLIAGAWGRLFGYWTWQDGRDRPEDRLPTWPLLNGYGQPAISTTEFTDFDVTQDVFRTTEERRYADWYSQFSDRCDELSWDCQDFYSDIPIPYSAQSSDHCQIVECWRRYVLSIPQPVRAIASTMGRYQWLALEATAQVDGAFEFFSEDSKGANKTFAVACWASEGAHLLSAARRKKLFWRIMCERRRNFLGDIHHQPISSSTIRSIRKMESREIEAGTIRKLIELVRDPLKAKFVNHQKTISAKAIVLLHRYPAGW
jgi:hypothetical protein